MELNPNCSELVMRLNIPVKDVLEKLKTIGIYEVKFKRTFEDGTSFVYQELLDEKNKYLPDFRYHANIRVCGFENETEIIAHQHCSHQIFKTLDRIERLFGMNFHGHDGGSTYDYEEWLKNGKPDPEIEMDDEWKRKRVELLAKVKGFKRL